MHWREQFTGRPLVMLALAAVAGVLLAEQAIHLPGLCWMLGLAALTCAWLTWKEERCLWPVGLAFCSFAFLHAQQLGHTRLHPLRTALEESRRTWPVEAEGSVERPLRRDLPGSEPGEALFIADELRCERTGRIWTGRTPLRLLPGKEVALPPGRYRVRGLLQLPRAPLNPGEFDFRGHQLRLGLVADLRATRVECLQPGRWNLAALLTAASESCRLWVAGTLAADLQDRPDERTIILAMALGSAETDSTGLQQPFRESGTLHIFAVSGLHVAIVGVILWTLLRPFGLRRGVMVAMLIPLLFGYAFITGLRPSAVRAALMAAVLLAGTGLHRRTDLLNSLGAAALLLVTLDTQQVFAPGFQLSFGVIAAIAIFTDIFTRPVRPWIDPDPFLPKPLLTNWQKTLWSARRWFAGLFTVSAAATLGSLPLMFGHFHLVTPVSLLANAVLVPMSFLVLGTAILGLLCGLVKLTPLLSLFNNANLFFAWFTLHAAQFFAGLPGAHFHLPDPSLQTRAPVQMTVMRLPGGGGAQWLRSGDRTWMLDAGAESEYTFLTQRCLAHLGVNRLDGLLLSHNDSEHTGAAIRLWKDFASPAVWEPLEALSHLDHSRSRLRQLRDAGLHSRPLRQGERLDLGGGVTAHVLHPLPGSSARRSDDRTLVLRLDCGNFRVLWCNDAGFIAEKTLLETLPPGELLCDVIVRNQHASDYSMLPEFLDATRPRLLISSNDSFPPEEKLPQRLRMACAARSIQLLDQMETGAVMLHIWPQRLQVGTMSGTAPLTLFPR